jgi:hypothetical protein
MRFSLAALLFFFSASAVAQLRVTEQFRNISTAQQAQQYIDANPRLKPTLLHLSAVRDTTIIDKRLLRQKKGDVFSVGYFTYKVLESTDTTDFRARYIFLDGSTYNASQIDSLKKLIVQKASAGTPFEVLSDQYTMDGNKTRGDTDWFAGEYSFPKEFLEAVQSHKFGEIFFVDVPEKQWHYIVKKTHNDRVKKHMTILKSVGR